MIYHALQAAYHHSSMTTTQEPAPRHFTAAPEDADLRLDRFLGRECPDFSRARLQEFIKSGRVLVNGIPAKPSHPLGAGDAISLEIPCETAPSPLAAEDIPLEILFEDDTLLVLNKPAGLVVHPGAGNREGTMANALLHHCPGIAVAGGTERPGIVHRLDKETSGCIVAVKTEAAHLSLSTQFASREVEKTYLALVDGVLRMPHGKIEAPIGRHPIHRQKMAIVERGREALTKYRLRATQDGKSLVECHPLTGRTHQIRVHLSHIGHVVVNDELYGGSFERMSELLPQTWKAVRTAMLQAPRQMLHAWRLRFIHPATGTDMEFEAPMPQDMLRLVEALRDSIAKPIG
jgi:23S rRNA pseudouridine1911/1915/1917 synthase